MSAVTLFSLHGWYKSPTPLFKTFKLLSIFQFGLDQVKITEDWLSCVAAQLSPIIFSGTAVSHTRRQIPILFSSTKINLRQYCQIRYKLACLSR